MHSERGAPGQAAEDGAGRVDGGRRSWKEILIGPDVCQRLTEHHAKCPSSNASPQSSRPGVLCTVVSWPRQTLLQGQGWALQNDQSSTPLDGRVVNSHRRRSAPNSSLPSGTRGPELTEASLSSLCKQLSQGTTSEDSQGPNI